MAILRPLQQQVKDQGLWAAHLGPELGGRGFGQVKLALLNEILGRSRWAPSVFGCQAPDSGNAEILALFGTDGAEGAATSSRCSTAKCTSCYSMTEPQGGSDPGMFVTGAPAGRRRLGHQRGEVVLQQRPVRRLLHRDGGDQSRRRTYDRHVACSSCRPRRRASRSSATSAVGGESSRRRLHGYVRYNDVRVPADHVLGGGGRGVRDRADPARRRPHPPRDAHDRVRRARPST